MTATPPDDDTPKPRADMLLLAAYEMAGLLLILVGAAGVLYATYLIDPPLTGAIVAAAAMALGWKMTTRGGSE